MALVLALPALARADPGPAPAIELASDGSLFRLRAAFEVPAAPAVAWDVLTDYDGMTRFVPSLRESRVISRAPDAIVIRQEGLVRFLVLSRRVPMTLKVVERAPERIDFSLLESSDFDDYTGSWSISPGTASCHVSYELYAEMRSSLVPQSIARRLLRRSISRQLQQVQAEIARRAAQGARAK